ncbi:MAG TPA: hypothetical protein DCG88_14730 [Sphingobacterium sp.]|nr:hypothetical protein [Sphingobacterium sp.]
MLYYFLFYWNTIWHSGNKEFDKMRKSNVKWKQRQEPPSFPKWLKSYHLLLAAMIVMLIFGAVMKHLSTV